jgi:hypothetical protein
MKHLLPLFVCSCSLFASAAALTLEDFSPSKLKGKTLEFVIESGTAPLATTGTWTGTFETSPADGFTIRNVTGNTSNGSGKWVYVGAPFPESHGYDITPFVSGKVATLTLWISEGSPRYYIDSDGVSQYGDVSIKSTSEGDIEVQQPKGSKLTDEKSESKFGTAKAKSKGISKTFFIKNTGDAKLSKIAVAVKGKHKGDFEVVQPKESALGANGKTSFKVTFIPSTKGKRKATLVVTSSDPDESPFEIEVSGEGSQK